MITIAFLGAGNIAQAIMGGMLANGMENNQLWAFDPSPTCMKWVLDQGINAAASNDEAIANANVIMLCVKPNVLLDALTKINVDTSGKLFVSVAAGITTEMIASRLSESTQIVRCMPNTPALIQAGMTALFATETVSDQQRDITEKVMNAVGHVVWVEREDELDAVTAVSGSGPAYFFLMMESMIAAAEDIGLSNALSRKLVIQTAMGAAKLAEQSTDDPTVLREKVTSPGGTTEAAIEYYLNQNFKNIIAGAISAAHLRSIEMAKKQ